MRLKLRIAVEVEVEAAIEVAVEVAVEQNGEIFMRVESCRPRHLARQTMSSIWRIAGRVMEIVRHPASAKCLRALAELQAASSVYTDNSVNIVKGDHPSVGIPHAGHPSVNNSAVIVKTHMPVISVKGDHANYNNRNANDDVYPGRLDLSLKLET